MSISFVAATTKIQNSGTTIVIDKPAGVVGGNLMLAVFFIEGASPPTITPPSGWTSLGTGTGSVTRGEVFAKIAGGSEPANYTFTSSLTIVVGSGSITAYRSSGSIIIGASVFEADTESPSVAPSVTTARPNSKLFCAFMTTALGSGVSGMTGRVALDNGSRDIGVFDEDIASAGATGTRTYTGSGAGLEFSLSIEEFIQPIRMMI